MDWMVVREKEVDVDMDIDISEIIEKHILEKHPH